MEHNTAPEHSPSWIFFVWASFSTSVFLTLLGIYYAPVELWVKGYFAMGSFFTVGSTFTLAKTVRDTFEARKQPPRFVDAKKAVHEYEARG